MSKELSLNESRAIMFMATDMRPDENVHHDPDLTAGHIAKGRPVTSDESARIMAMATDVRPFENIHKDEDGAAYDPSE